jgi:hypothetical protein
MITKDMSKSNEIMKNKHLQLRNVHTGLSTTKVAFLLSTVPPNILQKRQNDKYILQTRVFSRAARSSGVRSNAMRSIAVFAIECIRGFKLRAARPFNVNARVSADVDMRSNAPLGLECKCVRTQYVRFILRSNALLGDSYFIMHIFHPFNRILMSVICNALETPKTNKSIRK